MRFVAGCCAVALCTLVLAGCSDSPGGEYGNDAVDQTSDHSAEQDVVSEIPDTPDLTEDEETTDSSPSPQSFTVVTFSTGTGGFAPNEGNYEYLQQQAEYSDEWYGNGIAWKPFVEMTRDWFVQVQPDIVVFQEIFWPGECPEIPGEAQVGFVCEDWQEGDPTVAEMLLGEGYQVMCHPGKTDKCAAVHSAFGTFLGCSEPFCLEGLDGFKVDTCGSGARVARGVIQRVDGSLLTLVNVHGSSGFTDEDAVCRRKQFDQAFIELGDGEPGANGEFNLIMGDFNTDPGRLADSDTSAARLNYHVGPDKHYHFVTAVGPEAEPTYAGLFNIDHVISDRFVGTCWHAGVSEGHPPVMDALFFDHVPAVCELHLSAE